MKIPFNRPFLTGKETQYIEEAVNSGKISGNGIFTKKCQRYFMDKYGFKSCLLTTSCTDALEMAAILCGIEEGDEVILPSFTFVSTANAFVLRGAKLVFADSMEDNPNMDPSRIERLVSSRTKVIVVVHYAGVASDMDAIVSLAKRHSLFVVEDAAQAIDSYYKGKPLGSFGHFGAFSFHETKNVISGEGGLLAINDQTLIQRAEIIWEKGTNRSAFFRGEVDKYSWVDIGSSFLPSEIIAAFLYAQLEKLEEIQKSRLEIWNRYQSSFRQLAEKQQVSLPIIPFFATNNAHMYYLMCNSEAERNQLIKYLNSRGIMGVFHYLPLHESPFYLDKHDGRNLPNCNSIAKRIVRLPMYYSLAENEQFEVIQSVISFFQERNQ